MNSSSNRSIQVILILIASITVSLLIIPACGTSSAPDVDEDRLDELTTELGIRSCLMRMDSISFEIEGLIFHSQVDITDRQAVMALIPANLPNCPVSDLPYIFEDGELGLLIICPSGHGSVEID